MDSAVNELVVFLSNPNRKATEHVDTVMELVRELSKYKHELADARTHRDKLGSDLERALGLRESRNTAGFSQDVRARDYDPRHVTIPSNARSVEIKF
jgi:hypothetical protein